MKNIQKTSGTRKQYKPGQLVTINRHVYRVKKSINCYVVCFTCTIWDIKCKNPSCPTGGNMYPIYELADFYLKLIK